MSSHHIVRDEQEPALLIHRLSDFDTTHLHGLLEWSPTVVCCEPALERYLDLGHKVDIALVGLRNYESWQEALKAQQPLKIVAINDVQFMVTGLQILQKDHHRAVNLVTNQEAVFEVIDEMSDWAHLMDVVVFAGGHKYLFAKERFVKWLPAYSSLRAIALGEKPKWNVTGVDSRNEAPNSDEITFSKSEEGELSISCSVPFLIEEAL